MVVREGFSAAASRDFAERQTGRPAGGGLRRVNAFGAFLLERNGDGSATVVVVGKNLNCASSSSLTGRSTQPKIPVWPAKFFDLVL